MTDYFDSKIREVANIDTPHIDDEMFVRAVGRIEKRVVHDVRLVIGDREFPDSLRQRALKVISEWAVFPYPTELQHAVEELLYGRNSFLLDALHELFHKVASQRIHTRYGILSDSPWDILKQRDAWETEAFGSGVLSTELAMFGTAGQAAPNEM